MDIFRNKKRTVLSVADEHSQSPKSHKKKKDGSSSILAAKTKKELRYQYSDEEFVCSSSDSQPSSEEDTDSPGDDMNQASQTQRTLACRLTRREKQREELIRKKKEQNKISMDDFLNKQVEFHTWIEEEKRKIYHQMSSPKKKVYFRTFMKLWNKRKLPQKYYRGSEEIQSPHHSQTTINFNVFDEPDEFSHLTAIKRPKSKRLSVENGGFLHSPFSTFGKTPPKIQDNYDKENCTPVRPISTFASPRVRTNKNSHVSPILELSEYQIPLNSVRVPSLSSNEDVSCATGGRLIHPYSVMPLPWVTDSDTSSVKSDITDDEDHPKMTPPVTSVVYALPRKTQTKRPVVPVKKSSRPPPVPPKPRSGLVNYCSSVDSNSGYSVIYPRSAPDSVSIESDQSGDSEFRHGPIIDCHSNRSSMSDPGQRNVYPSLDSISLNSAESDPGYRVIPPATDDRSVQSMSCSSSVVESDEDLPLPPPPEIPSILLDYTQSDLPPPPSSPDKCPTQESVPIETIDRSPHDQVTDVWMEEKVKVIDHRNEDTKSYDGMYAESHTTSSTIDPPHTANLPFSSLARPQCSTVNPPHTENLPLSSLARPQCSTVNPPHTANLPFSSLARPQCSTVNPLHTANLPLSSLARPQCSTVNPPHTENLPLSSLASPQKGSLGWCRAVTAKPYAAPTRSVSKVVRLQGPDSDLYNSMPLERQQPQSGQREVNFYHHSGLPSHDVKTDMTDRVAYGDGHLKLDYPQKGVPGVNPVMCDRITADQCEMTTNSHKEDVKVGVRKESITRQGSPGTTETQDRVVSPGYVELDSIRNTTVGTVPSGMDNHGNTDTDDRVVSPGYVELDSIRNTTVGTVPSRMDNHGNTDTDDRVVSPGYVELDSIRNTTVGTVPFGMDNHGTTNTDTGDRVVSPGYMEMNRIRTMNPIISSDVVSRVAASNLLYAVPDEVFLSSPLPTQERTAEVGHSTETVSSVSDYMSMDVRGQGVKDSPGCTGNICREHDVDISPNVTTRRGRRRKTLRQGSTIAMDSCPTLEDLNLSRDIQDKGLGDTSQTEGPITHTEGQALQREIQMFTHLNNRHHSDKSGSVSDTHSSSYDVESCRSNSTDKDHQQKQTLSHLGDGQNFQSDRTGEDSQLYIKQDLQPTVPTSTFSSVDAKQQSQGSLSTQHPLRSLSTDLHPPRSLSTDLHPPRSLSTDLHPLRSLSTDLHPPRSLSTDQHPPRSLSTDQHPPRSLSTNQQPLRSFSTDQHPLKSLSTDLHPQNSSRIHQAGFHPTSIMKVVDSVFLSNMEAGVSVCEVTNPVSSLVWAQSNVKTQHNTNPPSKRGHMRNASISAPKWASNNEHTPQNPDPPSKSGQVRTLSVSAPKHVNVPNNVKTLHSSHPPVKSSHLRNPSLSASQQMTAPCSLTVLTQSPRKLQSFRDRIPVKKDKPLDIRRCHLPQVQPPIKVNSPQAFCRESVLEDKGEMLETDIDSLPGTVQGSSDKHIDVVRKPKLQRAESSETIIW